MVSKTDEAKEIDKPLKKSDIDQLITAISGRRISQKLEERWSEAIEAGKNINCPCKVTISTLPAVFKVFFDEDKRDDSLRQLAAQHSFAALMRHRFEWSQHCFNIFMWLNII